MSNPIGWCDTTWSPVTGCTPVSPACDHCYARRMAKRLRGRYGYPDTVSEWSPERGGCMVQRDASFDVTLHEDRLGEPLGWRKPRRVFVCSMGDLFHEDVPGAFINEVWRTMFNAPQHTYQILTKRPERLREWTRIAAHAKSWPVEDIWPDWIWLGVTAEDQQRANERIPILLDTPAAVRFVSVEPMLGPVRLDQFLDVAVLTSPHPMNAYGLPGTRPGLNWAICGGETGPGARPFDPQWARDLRDQCVAGGVPFWFKGGLLDGAEWHQRPGATP